MGPRIIIPVLLIAVIIPLGLALASRLRSAASGKGFDDAPVVAPAGRLTSNTLRTLPAPPWRVVYELSADRLGSVEHVLVGPPGVFAVQTSLDPLPVASDDPPAARDVAAAAIARGDLDDALARCGLASERTLVVHWGTGADVSDHAVDVLPGLTAVDGRELPAWLGHLDHHALSAAQVDLAWQTVVTAVGRPDPLAR